MASLVTEFTVYGDARPQGSWATFGNGKVTHSKRDSLMVWRHAIQVAIQMHAPSLRHQLIDGPVAVRAMFYKTRPSSCAKRAMFKDTAPDLDKLCRAVGDALERLLVTNDSRIAGWNAWKLYTEAASRLELQVWTLEQQDMAAVTAATQQPPQLDLRF